MRKLIVSAFVAASLVGGAGIAVAGPGLGQRPDGERGPRCAEALAHAAERSNGNGNSEAGLERAAENCQRAVERYADRQG